MQRIENAFSSMTWSDRCEFKMFVVGAGDDEVRCELGVTRLCCM